TALVKNEPKNLMFQQNLAIYKGNAARVEAFYDRQATRLKLLEDATAIHDALVAARYQSRELAVLQKGLAADLVAAKQEIKKREEQLQGLKDEVSELGQKLDQEPELDDVRQKLAAKLRERGQVLRGLGQTGFAVRSFDEAIKHSTKLATDYASIPKFRHQLI